MLRGERIGNNLDDSGVHLELPQVERRNGDFFGKDAADHLSRGGAHGDQDLSKARFSTVQLPFDRQVKLLLRYDVFLEQGDAEPRLDFSLLNIEKGFQLLGRSNVLRTRFVNDAQLAPPVLVMLLPWLSRTLSGGSSRKSEKGSRPTRRLRSIYSARDTRSQIKWEWEIFAL
jgi:hypothetical protein